MGVSRLVARRRHRVGTPGSRQLKMSNIILFQAEDEGVRTKPPKRRLRRRRDQIQAGLQPSRRAMAMCKPHDARQANSLRVSAFPPEPRVAPFLSHRETAWSGKRLKGGRCRHL